jgi:uncharacterized protein
MKRIFASIVLFGAIAAGAAHAEIGDPTLAAAIRAGQIGEQADGYLGAVSARSLPAQLKAQVDQANIRRRAAYTDQAAASKVTVDEMARATGCTLLAKNTPVGAFYRAEGGAWTKNADTVTLPSYCPK